MNITPEHTTQILKEMFSRVDETYTPEFTAQENWYHKHTWTEAEQEDFRQWLGKFLVKHKYARKSKYRGMPHGYYEAGKLIMNYGWKIK